jgi:hypothetical protein
MFGDIRSATGFVDLTQWPPAPVANYAEYAISFDVLPDGRVVVCSMLPGPKIEYSVRIHPADWPMNPTSGPFEEHPLPGGLTLAEVYAVSGRVVAFDTLLEKRNPAATHCAYLLDRGGFIPAPGLKPVTSFGADSYGHQIHPNGKVTLASGEEILVWDGDGYEWTGTRFERRWELGAAGRVAHGWTSVAWGADGFFYLSERGVMYARRGHAPVGVLPDAGVPFFLSPGPADSVIVCLVRDRKRHVARVWFPAEGTYAPLFRGHLGWSVSVSSGPLWWSEATGHVHMSPVWTFPGAGLLALDRVKPRGKGYVVPKG